MKNYIKQAIEFEWKIILENEYQNLTRLQRDEHRIDIWDSPKKGITVGMYIDGYAYYKRSVGGFDLTEMLADPDYIKMLHPKVSKPQA